ncbi:hypothetical protein V6N13_065633 [Hibiscus sabdariffa]
MSHFYGSPKLGTALVFSAEDIFSSSPAGSTAVQIGRHGDDMIPAVRRLKRCNRSRSSGMPLGSRDVAMSDVWLSN